jgi:NAD(P)-dependent dehydrogenase (short-subunit alcohol dehydrogenase family)
MKTFQGKVAAITGAGSGIGRALAVALAERGAHLALSDVNGETVAEVASALASKTRVTHQRVDVSKRDEVFAWAETVVNDHRGCNLIINNAGVALAATAEGAAFEDFEWLMGINFWGVVHGTQAFLPHLRASRDGHVVNLSSCFGLAGIPGQSAYNASKFAVRGYTESLRQELEITRAPVSATCVHPGGIKTNILRAARLHTSMKALGVGDPEGERGSFERMFRTSADEAARQILRGVETNARRVLIGSDARALDAIVRLAPTGYQAIVSRLSTRLRGKP